MAYNQITFICEDRDLIISFLDSIPFNGFQETENGFIGFISEEKFLQEHKNLIEKVKHETGIEFQNDLIQNENWNEKWESSFQPVIIDNFCAVRADFHASIPGIEHDIVINPKMAFGTGHHATTSAVMSLMKTMEFKNKTVFDYGCGTGILAILAEKLEAKEIFCIDIEAEAYLNTLENISNNNCTKISVKQGDIVLLENSYDIILANINRNVILDSIPTLSQRLNKGGILVISGFLKEDEQIVLEKLKEHAFIQKQIKEINGWLCILAKNLV